MSKPDFLIRELSQGPQSHQDEDGQSMLRPGLRRALRYGLVYLDPDKGVAPTTTLQTTLVLLSLVDGLIETAITLLLAAGLGWLVAQTPLAGLLPTPLMAGMPLWQLTAVVGMVASVWRFYVSVVFATKTFDRWVHHLLTH